MRRLLLLLPLVLPAALAGCAVTRLPPEPDWEGLAPTIREVVPGSGGPLIVVHGPEGPSTGHLSDALRRTGIFTAVAEVYAQDGEPRVRVLPPEGGWLLQVVRFDDGGRPWFRCGTGMFFTLGLIPSIRSGDWTFHYRLSPGPGAGGAEASVAVPGTRGDAWGWAVLPLHLLPGWGGHPGSDEVADRMARHLLRGMVEAGVGDPME